jgi:hypothetical protein
MCVCLGRSTSLTATRGRGGGGVRAHACSEAGMSVGPRFWVLVRVLGCRPLNSSAQGEVGLMRLRMRVLLCQATLLVPRASRSVYQCCVVCFLHCAPCPGWGGVLPVQALLHPQRLRASAPCLLPPDHRPHLGQARVRALPCPALRCACIPPLSHFVAFISRCRLFCVVCTVSPRAQRTDASCVFLSRCSHVLDSWLCLRSLIEVHLRLHVHTPHPLFPPVQ